MSILLKQKNIPERFKFITAFLLIMSCLLTSVRANAVILPPPPIHALNVYTVNVPALNVRIAPNINAKRVAKLRYGKRVRVVASSHGWKKIYGTGPVSFWVAGQYLKQARR